MKGIRQDGSYPLVPPSSARASASQRRGAGPLLSTHGIGSGRQEQATNNPLSHCNLTRSLGMGHRAAPAVAETLGGGRCHSTQPPGSALPLPPDMLLVEGLHLPSSSGQAV